MAEGYSERNAALREQMRRDVLVTLRRLARAGMIGDPLTTRGRMVARRIEP